MRMAVNNNEKYELKSNICYNLIHIRSHENEIIVYAFYIRISNKQKTYTHTQINCIYFPLILQYYAPETNNI